MIQEKRQLKPVMKVSTMVTVSVLSALAYVLMLMSLPYKHLGFLEFEFSDVPAVVGGLVYGPAAGVLIELIKNLIKAVTATTTGGVGEMANFLISICYVIPTSIIFQKMTGKKKVLVAFGVGMLGMITAGILVNYFITVPLYAKLFGGMDKVVSYASANIPAIKGLGTIVIIGITPYNIVKSLVMSITGYYTYKLFKDSLK